MENVTWFKYLVRVLETGDNYWTEVADSLRKARNSWRRMSRILGQEGGYPNISGLFFKAVAQAVFLFRLETWFLISRVEWALGSFQNRVV